MPIPAGRASGSVATAQREVSRAELAGIVTSRRLGNTRLAREVNITLRSPTWWREGTDGFHTEVNSRPIIPVLEGVEA